MQVVHVSTGRGVALLDLDQDHVLEADELLHRHSPYLGLVMRGRVVRTLVRGNVFFDGCKVASGPLGRPGRPTG